MKINTSLLPMKLHYFFMFGGTAPLIPFLPVYINQKLNMSYQCIGLIYTILPFFGLFAKAVSGALADLFKAHKATFLSSIILCAIGFFSLMFAPAMPTLPNEQPVQLQFDCSSPHSYLRHAIDHKCSPNMDVLKTDTMTMCELECKNSSDKLAESLCGGLNISSILCKGELLKFSALTNTSHATEDSVEVFFPVSEIYYSDHEVENPRCSHLIQFNCTAKCNNSKIMEFLGAPKYISPSTYAAILSEKSFWIFLVLFGIAWSGLGICVVLSDTICFTLLGSEASKYGKQRLFGSVGWGTFVIMSGFLIDVTTSDLQDKNYTAAFILSICALSIDLFIASRLQVNIDTKERLNLSSAIFNLGTEPRIVLFVICCLVVGVSTGILWTYQLILVEETVLAWDCHFEHMKLLQGLIVGVSCFGGELPFFFVSGYFIKMLGHIHAMSLVIAVFGLRFILYSAVSNPWLFLPIELLNGFTFGIFYAVMTSYASMIAPPGGQATVQGIVGAVFEGLGVASGCFIGGALFSAVGGGMTFLYMGIFNVIYSALHVSVQISLNKCSSRPQYHSPSDLGQYNSPSNDGFHPEDAEEEHLPVAAGVADLHDSDEKERA